MLICFTLEIYHDLSRLLQNMKIQLFNFMGLVLLIMVISNTKLCVNIRHFLLLYLFLIL